MIVLDLLPKKQHQFLLIRNKFMKYSFVFVFIFFLSFLGVAQSNLTFDKLELCYKNEQDSAIVKKTISSAIIILSYKSISNISMINITIGDDTKKVNKFEKRGWEIEYENNKAYVVNYIDSLFSKRFFQNNKIFLEIDLSDLQIDKITYCRLNYFDIKNGWSKDIYWVRGKK